MREQNQFNKLDGINNEVISSERSKTDSWWGSNTMHGKILRRGKGEGGRESHDFGKSRQTVKNDYRIHIIEA